MIFYQRAVSELRSSAYNYFKKYQLSIVTTYKKRHFKFVIITLALLVILSYGLTLGMYIWQDDNAIMFKLQHLSEGAGNLGAGIFDRNTPYRGVMIPLVPLYAIFGLEPVGYFLFGLIIYFFASLTVYFLAKELSNNRNFAFGSASIFAAGFVGGETLWRIYNSIHTILNIIFICISLIFYTKCIKDRNILKYIISLFFFWIAMETGYVRAHGIIFLVIGLELIFNFHLLKSFIRLLPFGYLYYHYYLQSNAGSAPVRSFLNKVFYEGRIEILFAPFVTLKNIIIPDTFNIPDWIFIVLLFSILIWKRSKILWFSVIFMMQSYLVPFVHNQGQIFASLHRYLTLSLVGLGLFYSELFRAFFSFKKSFFIAIFVIALIHLYLIDKEQIRIVQHIGIPTRNFYAQLKQEIKNLPKGAAIYFDVKDDKESNNQFYNFFGVGSMPETTAIAIYYGVDRYDLFLPATYNELLSLLKNNKTSSDRIFTFYYDAKQGLINTTNRTRSALFGKKQEKIVSDMNNVNISFSSPQLFKFSALVTIDESSLKYTDNRIDLKKYLSYLKARQQFYREVSATASSQWKYQEVVNLADNNLLTSWMAHRGDWHYNRKADVTLDLGSNRDIGVIKMVLRSKSKAPSKYRYECSINGSSFREIGNFYNNPTKDYEVVFNKVSNSLCRYIRMYIEKTVGDDEPQLSEMEVIDSKFGDLDPATVDNLLSNPFSFITSDADKIEVLDYINTEGFPAKVCVHTNKLMLTDENSCQRLNIYPIKEDYEVIIPSRGTILKKIELKTFPEIQLLIKDITISDLSLRDLNSRGYIFDYSQN